MDFRRVTAEAGTQAHVIPHQTTRLTDQGETQLFASWRLHKTYLLHGVF